MSAGARMHYHRIDSPVGPLLLAGGPRHLKHVLFARHGRAAEPGAGWDASPTPVLLRTEAQLESYFAGELACFELPLSPDGTPFQREVWRALLGIAFGETRSYGEVARLVGRPRASRAVGAANGRNPIPIIIPCHRVIGADGGLTGFGGGIEVKRALLDHERAGAGDARRQPKLL